MITFEYKIPEASAKGFFGGKLDTPALTGKLNELAWLGSGCHQRNQYVPKRIAPPVCHFEKRKG